MKTECYFCLKQLDSIESSIYNGYWQNEDVNTCANCASKLSYIKSIDTPHKASKWFPSKLVIDY